MNSVNGLYSRDNDAKIYENATTVNIHTAHQVFSEERASGYDGEFEVFRILLHLSDEEYFKILMNLEVPVSSGDTNTTEIDSILLTEVGLIVFEVKNYKGKIYGRKSDNYWTQYFRTASNQKFRNPIRQNDYHVQALKELYPNVPIYSVIVFANRECDIRLITFRDEMTSVIALDNVSWEITRILAKPKTLHAEEIEGIFASLSHYAKVSAPDRIYAGSNINSYDELLSESRKACEKAIKQSIEKYNNERKALRKKYGIRFSIGVVLCAVIASLGIGIGSYFAVQANKERDSAIAERDEMAENFQPVSESDLTFCNDYILVSNVNFSTDTIYENAVSLTFDVNTNSNKTAYIEYAGSILIVKLKSGEVKYFDVCSCTNDLKYVSSRDFDSVVTAGPFYITCNSDNIESVKLSNAIFFVDATHRLERNGRTVDIHIYG